MKFYHKSIQYFTIFFTIFFIHGSTLAQNKYLELIKQNNFVQAEKIINNELLDKFDDVAINYAMSVLLLQPKYKKFNIEKSYRYLTKTVKLYSRIKDERMLKKLSKIGINDPVLSNFNNNICKLAFDDALQTNTIAQYSKYLDNYKTAPILYKQKATYFRDSIAYQTATAANTIESYQVFVTKYSKSHKYQEALEKLESIAYHKALIADSIIVYKKFISNYPLSKQVNFALSRVYKLAYNEASRINTSESYRLFSTDYPLSPQYSEAFKLFEKKQYLENIKPGAGWLKYKSFFEKYPSNSWKKVAFDSIYSYAKKTENLDAMQYCVDNSSASERERLLIHLHQIFTQDGEKMTYDLFYKKYNDEVLSPFKEKDYKLSEMSKTLLLHRPFNSINSLKYDTYIRLAAPLEKAFVALQRLISVNIENKDWKKALQTVNLYLPVFGKSNEKVIGLIHLLEKKIDKSVKITSVGNSLNSAKGGEYAPVISADDKSLYFCGSGREDNIGGEDIFVSQKMDGVWQSAKVIKELSFKKSNDAPLSISADATTMLLFKSGKIFHSDKSEKGWTTAIVFPANINACSWQADAMISSNGKAMFFASTKSGGYNLFSENSISETYHGGNQYFSDIYVSLLTKMNKWSEPINLGPIINTRYCDRMPYLHPDMKTLYFSSDGHGGLGELDVFKSTRLADSCWNCWSEPVNMGKEINTSSSDWGYKISTDGTTAYFAKNTDSQKNFDVYSLNLPKELQPNPVTTISGKIVDSNNQPISVDITWIDLETGVEIGQSKSDPTDGNFFIVLPIGKHYRYTIDRQKYVPITNDIDLRNEKKTFHIENNLKLVTYNEILVIGNLLPYSNILFNTASSDLLELAKHELKQAAKIINQYHLKIEIIGHTDIIGNDNKNQNLSMNRAMSAKAFLIKEGCSEQSLTIAGYGIKKPIATNKLDIGRTKNRRVELKIVGK